MFTLDKSIYRRSQGLIHGPSVWPWWKLLTVTINRCSHDPANLFWMTPISYNVWFYTRWGARCLNVRERKGIYRRDEDGCIDLPHVDVCDQNKFVVD